MKKILITLSIFVLTIIGNLSNDFNTTKNHLVKNELLTNNKTTVHENDHHFIFNHWIKNNKDEIFAKSDDGFYKYHNDNNTFTKLEGINEEIIDLKFDTEDNIYSLTENAIYKCPYNKIKFVKMKVLSNSNIFSFTNLKIDQSNNIYIYIWSGKNGVYQCLNNNTEFNKIGGIHLDEEHNFKICLFFSQNNIYAVTIKNTYNKKIYKCLVNETEFTLIDYKSKENDNFTAELYRFTVDEIGNAYILSKNFYNFTTIVYKYLFTKNKFIKITGLPVKNGINNNVQLKIDSKNNIYVLNLYNKIYKCLVNETQFKEIPFLNNDSITSIDFDYKDNIYLLTNHDVFKCLVNEMEFKAMTIEENYKPRKIVINKNNNVYLIDTDSHIYNCSVNDMKFKLMTGWPGIPCILKFDKNNNIYAKFKNGIYKCLADETEFKAMKGLSRSITSTTFDTNGNIFALAKKIIPINVQLMK